MNILVVGPHPDDQEIGMGGTIALLASQGHDVLILDVTDGCPTPVGDRPTRLREADDAAKVLSDAAGRLIRRHLLDLPNRRVEHSLASRHAVAGVIRAHQASIIFLPHPEDAHPDHLAVTRIVEDARFDAKLTNLTLPGDHGRPPIYPAWLIYYYCSHLRAVPSPTFIVDTSAFADARTRAVLSYKSQFVDNPKNRGVAEWLAAGSRYFGSRINAQAGEPFWTREPLGLSSLSSLTGA
jgi:LmbE family N-acetylglucosaminyl deacetylase